MKIDFTKEQISLLNKVDIDFDFKGDINHDQLMDLDEAIGEYMEEHGIGDDDKPNETGKLCIEIMDLL